MAITHGAATRSALASAVLADIDAGTAGNLVFRTSGAVAVATLPLSAVSGVVAAEVLTFNAITSDTNAAGGVVSNFTVESSAGTAIFSGTVAVSGADINMSSLTVGAGDTIATSSLSYTAAV